MGGVSGWWCQPPQGSLIAVILYLHGGGYILGSADAYRFFVGHIAVGAGMSAFVVEYAVAPERSFSAALEDALVAYRGLASYEYTDIGLPCDSAGTGSNACSIGKVQSR